MKVSDDLARASMRFSFGRFNTEADVDKALAIVPAAISKLRSMSPAATVRESAAV
jgi:cysteine desulfurase